MSFPITENLERELINAGVLTDAGLIIRPKLRNAFDRIVDNGGKWTLSGVIRAEYFILGIYRYAKNHGLSFDDAAESLGY